MYLLLPYVFTWNCSRTYILRTKMGLPSKISGHMLRKLNTNGLKVFSRTTGKYKGYEWFIRYCYFISSNEWTEYGRTFRLSRNSHYSLSHPSFVYIKRTYDSLYTAMMIDLTSFLPSSYYSLVFKIFQIFIIRFCGD